MANSRAANCIFCDDIRQEIGNKISLMGVFATDILFPQPAPVVLPKFGVVVWILFDVGDEPKRLRVRVLLPPDRKEIAIAELAEGAEIAFPYPPDELSTGSIRVVIPLPPVQLSEEGFLEVMCETERETLRAGRLRIRFNVNQAEIPGLINPSSVPSPLSSQPQSDAQEPASPLEPSRPARPARRRRT
jgi:hypothetical protein